MFAVKKYADMGSWNSPIFETELVFEYDYNGTQ